MVSPGSAGEIPDCLRYVIPDILAEGLVVTFGTTEDHQIVFTNKRFAEMCGRSADALLGRRLSELYDGRDYAVLEEHMAACDPDSSHRFEFFVPRPGDRRIQAMLGLRRLPVSETESLFVVSVTDITGLKKAHRALTERQAMIEADLAVAERVQRSLFPDRLVVDGIEVVTTYRPMLAIGGDFAWVSYHKGRSVHAVVGDVTGHGIAASLIANRLATESAHYAAADKCPADMLVAVNRASLSLMGEPGTFCTAAAVRVDTQDQRIYFSGAGHPPAFLARRSGVVEPLYSRHLILGILERIGPSGAGTSWPFEEGDQLIMYTDGLPETQNAQREMFGYFRLREAIREAIGATAEEMGAHILGRVDAFHAGSAEDDVTLVVLAAGVS